MIKTNQLINCSTNQPSRRGFTLMEVLVVIVIIGILASATFFILRNVRMRGRDAKRKQDIERIQTAVELYNHENGFYPIPTGNQGLGRGDSFRTDWDACPDPSKSNPSGPNRIACLLNKYLPRLPFDPIQGNKPVGAACIWGSASFTYTGNPYDVPCVTPGVIWYNYTYFTPDSGKHYFVGANLENTKERMPWLSGARPVLVGGNYSAPETTSSYYIKNY